ncbi:hypothetical protein BsIDN1_47170 [Bacillus safensis]|uniref:Uncharacterized protein n=1 Tax=Bacillus safensis TaxID=561879 RepID=A0A5S9MH02_BACIA|nr:hypothetical protein BsIDN1_47170 [Bacillus safensis]
MTIEDDRINDYIEHLIHPSPDAIAQLEIYAKEHHVPIMEKVSIELLLQLLSMKKAEKKFLRLGQQLAIPPFEWQQLCQMLRFIRLSAMQSAMKKQHGILRN